jgi:pyruvate dehydrogenase E1 component alpha subunit
MSRDPVPLFRAWLVAQKVASEEQVAEMDAAIAREIAEARDYALGSADPGIEELGLDVYASEVQA